MDEVEAALRVSLSFDPTTLIEKAVFVLKIERDIQCHLNCGEFSSLIVSLDFAVNYLSLVLGIQFCP